MVILKKGVKFLIFRKNYLLLFQHALPEYFCINIMLVADKVIGQNGSKKCHISYKIFQISIIYS